MKKREDNANLSCSFCGKSQKEVKKLIAGPAIYICDECIDLCNNIIADEYGQEASGDSSNLERTFAERMVGQELARRVLVAAVSNHRRRTALGHRHVDELQGAEERAWPTRAFGTAPNVLLMGPPGCGKSLGIQTAAKESGCPWAVLDVTRIRGGAFLKNQDLSQQLAQSRPSGVDPNSGIICLEHVDRIASRGPEVDLKEREQESLLEVLSGTVISSRDRFSRGGRRSAVDTSKVLFLAAGCFEGISGIVQQRLARDPESGSTVIPADLVEFGFIPELADRFGVIVRCEALTESQLRQILDLESNLLHDRIEMFRASRIDVSFDSDALDVVAAIAARRGGGGRALDTVLESVVFELSHEVRLEAPLNEDDESATAEEGETEAPPLMTLRVDAERVRRALGVSSP